MRRNKREKLEDEMTFSISLPRDTVAKIDALAGREYRSRSAQISKMLAEAAMVLE